MHIARKKVKHEVGHFKKQNAHKIGLFIFGNALAFMEEN
jgi:hypothetical protein